MFDGLLFFNFKKGTVLIMVKKEIISKNRDFRRVYTKGKYFSSPVLITYIIKNRLNSTRVGITASKKTGNAVKRNRSRRIIREAFRILKSKVKSGFDIIFVARAKTNEVKTGDVLKDMEYELYKLGVLKWKSFLFF